MLTDTGTVTIIFGMAWQVMTQLKFYVTSLHSFTFRTIPPCDSIMIFQEEQQVSKDQCALYYYVTMLEYHDSVKILVDGFGWFVLSLTVKIRGALLCFADI